jgi:putative mRNA 3-end processing factor
VIPRLIELTPIGLYCPAGDFYIDPWRSVPRAIITHAHSDHARIGSDHYLCSREGERVLKARLGSQISLRTVSYGEEIDQNGVKISLHPAGHVLGSAQIRIEHHGVVWVVTGDYKIESDRTCTPYEPVRCQGFLTESTFGLPIYRWRPQAAIFEEINQWWRNNQSHGKASLLMGYSLGKTQRLLGGIDPGIGPIFAHGAVQNMNQVYRDSGIELPETNLISTVDKKFDWTRALIIAPPSVQGTSWTSRFGTHSTAFASGWMHVRGMRRRRAMDRGFVLSDHVDWPGLMQAIKNSEAETIWVTHGSTAIVVRYLQEQGYDAAGLETQFQGEAADAEPEAGVEAP